MSVSPVDPLSGVVHLAVWRVAMDREEHVAAALAWPAEVVEALGLAPERLQELPAPAALAAELELMIA
jgi:hypothetical protein